MSLVIYIYSLQVSHMLSISIISVHQMNHANNVTYVFFRCTMYVYLHMHTYDMCIQSFYCHVARVNHCHVLHYQCIMGSYVVRLACVYGTYIHTLWETLLTTG